MSKRKPFWDTNLNPIIMQEFLSWETEQDRRDNKSQQSKAAKEKTLKRKEMRKRVELETGIKTRQNKKSNGVIEILVQNNDYDNMYENVITETENL